MLAGDQRAFDAFFAANAPRLAAFAARRSDLDAASLEDVVQSALVKAVQKLGGYRGDAALFTWLAGICRNELIDLHRKSERRPGHVSLSEAAGSPHSAAQFSAPEAHEPAAILAAQQRRDQILKILASLPERYALVLEAKYGDGLAVEEIARQMGTSATAIQSLLARAREAFRERWEEGAVRAETGAGNGVLPA